MDDMLKMSRSGVWDFGWEVCGLKKLVRCHVLSLLDADSIHAPKLPPNWSPEPQTPNAKP